MTIYGSRFDKLVGQMSGVMSIVRENSADIWGLKTDVRELKADAKEIKQLVGGGHVEKTAELQAASHTLH